MEKLFKLNYGKTLRECNLPYLGNFNQSAKMKASGRHGTITYSLYLAPWDMSGYNVCAGGEHCHVHCLNGSGRNKADIALRGVENSRVNIGRIKRTRLFYQNRPTFMRLLIHELIRTKAYAERINYDFSVRLNCTSDLSPSLFVDPDTGLNVLELFPNVQFYDYTKVLSRYVLAEKHKNYHLTFSYDGYNDEKCLEVLKYGGQVAVVFLNQKELPSYFMGYPVVDGNEDDIRYKNGSGVIIGLHYHRTAADYVTGKFVEPQSRFIIKDNDPRNIW